MSNAAWKLLCIALVAHASVCALAAQSYPTRHVRLLVPFSAGSGSDTIGRIVAKGLTQYLSQQVIVDNRAGAAGNIGAELAARSPADGYTLMFAGRQLATNPAMMKAGYNPEQDIQMITQFNSLPVVLLVRADSPWQTMTDVTAAMKSAAAAR